MVLSQEYCSTQTTQGYWFLLRLGVRNRTVAPPRGQSLHPVSYMVRMRSVTSVHFTSTYIQNGSRQHQWSLHYLSAASIIRCVLWTKSNRILSSFLNVWTFELSFGCVVTHCFNGKENYASVMALKASIRLYLLGFAWSCSVPQEEGASFISGRVQK